MMNLEVTPPSGIITERYNESRLTAMAVENRRYRNNDECNRIVL